MTMTKFREILLIDDDPDVGELVATTAAGLGIRCTITTEATSFLNAITPSTTLIFLDLVMPNVDGIELLRMLSHLPSTPPIVLMSGIGRRIMETAETLAESLQLTVVAQLHKPFRLVELESILDTHFQATNGPVLSKAAIPSSGLPDIEDSELLKALERNEFLVHYQPQIDLLSGEATGLEALVRWQHPTRGLVFPDEFIPLAEKHGHIDHLGWLVANRGLADIKKFPSRNGKPLALSLNVSVLSLHDLAFPDRLLSLARIYGVDPENIVLELTETGLLKNLPSTLDVLTRLRIKNIQLSIDDFGTGYAMMTQLRNIPATELKIDRSFVMKLPHSNGDRVMVQKTIEIGHELSLRVVAEGVENKQQLDFLREQKCDIAQGFLFSRALAPGHLLDWLSAYQPAMA